MAERRKTEDLTWLADVELRVVPAGESPWRVKLRAPKPVSFLCVNCDQRFPADGTRKGRAYCSVPCRGEAKAVRYARRKRVEYRGSRLPADIEEAIRMKLMHALGGGYDETARRLTREQRAAILKRDGYHCVRCGAGIGLEIDHVAGFSSDPNNLQTLCTSCHKAKTAKSIRQIEPGSPTDEKFTELRERVETLKPLLPCDEPGWNWSAWIKEHTMFEGSTAARIPGH